MWRARLRLFLCPGGELAEKRALESSVRANEVCQTAVNLTAEGICCRHEFFAVDFLNFRSRPGRKSPYRLLTSLCDVG